MKLQLVKLVRHIQHSINLMNLGIVHFSMPHIAHNNSESHCIDTKLEQELECCKWVKRHNTFLWNLELNLVHIKHIHNWYESYLFHIMELLELLELES